MPFSRTTASADTCVLSDFIAADQPGLLLRLFPDGIWVDPSVIVELEERFGPAIRARVAAGGLTLLVERDYAASDYAEMAEIKRTRPAMRHPDIASVVLARKNDGTCLSSDGAVRKTCAERQIRIAGQLGCLRVCVERRMVTKRGAEALLQTFLNNGLYLPRSDVEQFLKAT